MIDLSLFNDTCAYCYKGIKESIIVCSCGISLCDDHKELHFSKMGCNSLYSLSFDSSDNVKVEAPFDKEDLEKRINIKVKNGMNSSSSSKECIHVYNSKNVKREIKKEFVKCDHCDITENIWICLDCGHMGCGRQQEGAIGNGHGIQHFKESNHSQSVLSSSISEGHGDTFCYCCDDFILNPYSLQIEISDNEVKSFEDMTGEKAQVSIPSNIIGMVNEGLTCYISSVLHLICEILKDYDLSEHFIICDSNPMNCICCQLIKIFNESQSVKNEIKSIRIVGFLKCFFNDHPEFSFKKQEDSSEFLYIVLESLKNYESCMLFPPVSKAFEYSITESYECNKCKKSKKDCFKSEILYLPFQNSLRESFQKYFESTSVPCECGGCFTRLPFFDVVPKFLIASIGRHKYDKCGYIKIEDDIELDSFDIKCHNATTIENFNLSLKGAIIHKGKETDSGHYTWWVKEESGDFLANDDVITKSNENYPKQGNVFLLKSQKCSY